MQESCTYGSVRGAPSNGCPYRNRQIGNGFEASPETGPIEHRAVVSSEHLPALGKAIDLPGGRSTSRRSPPNEVAPSGPSCRHRTPSLVRALASRVSRDWRNDLSARNPERCRRIARPISCRHRLQRHSRGVSTDCSSPKSNSATTWSINLL